MTKNKEVGQAIQPPFVKAPIATIDRILRVSLVLFPVFVFCVFLYWSLYRDGELVRYGWGPLVLLLPTIGLSLHIWTTTGRKINTRNDEEYPWRISIFGSPWVRYALAILLCGIVWELDLQIESHETEVEDLAMLRLGMGFLLFIAAYFARELVFYTLPFVLAWHLFKMLPNVDKVILIAIIVAAFAIFWEDVTTRAMKTHRDLLERKRSYERTRSESGFITYTSKKESGED